MLWCLYFAFCKFADYHEFDCLSSFLSTQIAPLSSSFRFYPDKNVQSITYVCDNVITRNLISLSCFFAVYFYFSFRNQDKILQVEPAHKEHAKTSLDLSTITFSTKLEIIVDVHIGLWWIPYPSIGLSPRFFLLRLSHNILIHYLSLSIKSQSFHEGEKPSLPGNFFPIPGTILPPTITNGRVDECEWSFSTFLIVLFLFAHFAPFSRQTRLTYRKPSHIDCQKSLGNGTTLI